jgi:ankyrin repeat protein
MHKMTNKKIIIAVFITLGLLQANMVFAGPDEDFGKALAKNDLVKAEKILQSKSKKMDLPMFLHWIFTKNINNGFDYENSIKVAQMLIRHGADVNAVRLNWLDSKTFYDAPLLGILIRSGAIGQNKELEMIDLLIDAGASPNASSFGAPILVCIAFNYKDELKFAFLKKLIERGADVNAKASDGNTAISGCINDFDLVKYLVEHKADVNIRNDKGETVLIAAAKQDKTDVVKYLVEKGANVNLRAEDGTTAASIAYDKGNIDIYDYLKAHGARDFEPKQVAQAAPAASPQSTTNVYVAPSQSAAPAQSAPAAPAGWNLSVLAGTNNIGGSWSSSVGNGVMVLNGNGSSGTVSIQANGKYSTGSASISGNTLNLHITSGQFSGQQFAYRIVNNKLIQGDGENFSRY